MCLILRRLISAREEEEGEKREPAETRQARRLHGDVQGEEQPGVVGLGEEAEEEQTVCPKGSIVNFWFMNHNCVHFIFDYDDHYNGSIALVWLGRDDTLQLPGHLTVL